MNMPIMDGCSFLNVASKEFPECKFIVVSGYDSFNYAQEALRCGAIDYLLKPIEEEALSGAIEKALSMLSDYTTPEPSPKCMSPEEVAADIRDYIDCNYHRISNYPFWKRNTILGILPH